jgi:hypothetical protein
VQGCQHVRKHVSERNLNPHDCDLQCCSPGPHPGQPALHGHQVWNRQRTDKDLADSADVSLGHRDVQRWNLRDGWVISRRPAHQALVSEADYIAAQDISASRGLSPRNDLASPGRRCGCRRAAGGGLARRGHDARTGLSPKRGGAPAPGSVPRWPPRPGGRNGTWVGAPLFGYRFGDAGRHPDKAPAAWGRRAYKLEPDRGPRTWCGGFRAVAGRAQRRADHAAAERCQDDAPVGGGRHPEPAPHGRVVDAAHGGMAAPCARDE